MLKLPCGEQVLPGYLLLQVELNSKSRLAFSCFLLVTENGVIGRHWLCIGLFCFIEFYLFIVYLIVSPTQRKKLNYLMQFKQKYFVCVGDQKGSYIFVTIYLVDRCYSRGTSAKICVLMFQIVFKLYTMILPVWPTWELIFVHVASALKNEFHTPA